MSQDAAVCPLCAKTVPVGNGEYRDHLVDTHPEVMNPQSTTRKIIESK